MAASRFAQAVASFAILVLLYWGYERAIVPLIESAPAAANSDANPSTATVAQFESPTARFQPVLEPLFRPDSWERAPDVTVARKGNILLVFRSQMAGEQLHLKPCTLVYLPTRPDGRTWIVQATEGAELKFDQPIDTRSGVMGKIKSGFLPGQVVISGTPLLSDGSDRIEIDTRGVQMTEQSISTTQDVHFRVGQSFGSGRDLTIRLKSPESGPVQRLPSLSPALIQHVELVHLDQAVLFLPADNKTSLPGSAGPGLPVTVACSGPITWDLSAGVAQMNREVRVTRERGDLPPEQLQCDLLTAHFAIAAVAPTFATDGAAAEPAANSLPNLLLQRIVANGRPAIVTTTTGTADGLQRWHQLTSARLEYDVGQEVAAAGSSPQPPSKFDGGFGGGFRAFGSGDYQTGIVTSQGPDPGSEMELAWREQVSMRPVGSGIEVTIVGDGICNLKDVGRIRAGRMQVDLQNRSRQTGGGPTAVSSSNLELHKIVAQEQVQIDTDQLVARTQRMQIDVRELPSAQPPVANALTSDKGLLLLPPSGAATSGASTATRKFDVSGDTMHVQLLREASQHHLEDISIEGRVRCIEQQVAAAGRPHTQIEMRGDRFRLQHFSQQGGLAHIHGSPAQVRARQMNLAGSNIYLDRDQNEMWIEGRGSATLPLPAKMAARYPNRPGTADIRWEGGLRFDGRAIQCQQQVMVTGPAQRIKTDELTVMLTQPVDFGAGDLDSQQIGIDTIVADGAVELENRTLDTRGWVSLDRAQATRLQIDHSTQQVTGTGPGWIESVRRGSPALPGTENGDSLRSGQDPLAGNETDDGLMFLRVSFQQGFEGNLARRLITFEHGVQAIYGPVQDWNERLTTDARDQLQPETAMLKCHQLQVFQLPGQPDNQFELMATGNTRVQGRSTAGQLFAAQAHRLSYHQSKDLLMLEGDGRSDAQLWYQRQTGGKWSTLPAQQIRFWPKANRYKVEGVPMLDLSDLGN